MTETKKQIDNGDFNIKFASGFSYLSYAGKKCEICIEFGIGCVDVAVYDLKQELLEPKITVSTKPKAFEIANKFYEKWEIKE